MSTVIVKRAPRTAAPPMPEGQVELAEPPVLDEPARADLSSMTGMLPMALGMGTMAMMFSVANGSPSTYLMSGMMGASMATMSISQIGRGSGERKRRLRAERRDYLRYLSQLRTQAEQAAEAQRLSLAWDNPDPAALWSLACSPRLWERRGGHDDFARVRIGLGRRRAALEFIPPQTKPVEDLEPLCAISLRRFAHAHQTVSGLPVTVGLRNFTSVEFAGEAEPATALLRAMVGQLAAFHSPDELRLALLTDDAGLTEWDWFKWLPHSAHPRLEDEAGPLRLVATDHEELIDLLGPDFADRAEHDPAALPGIAEPFVVVVAHRTRIPTSSRMLGGGVRNSVLLDATGAMPGGPKVLRLHAEREKVRYPVGETEASARIDALGRGGADHLARLISPKRTGGGADLADKPLESDFELTTLLGIRNPRTFDVAAKWRPRAEQSARLRVPIGVTEQGEIVELDVKESAQGGMGPHGLLIGATGSGKSELLRTLIVGLAATHSSEILNFVLVDFKGGATFMNMDRLPHTSAVITNLAGELALVDRMQDSINGEVIRRQELLRESGRSSLYDYEKARAAGAPLSPLPTLLVVVDEFSELLASKPEFIELFVTIGRVGRSLGVHLLLASQRLDEGRIHKVEGHLSYRVALRTFSSMESRSVIGVSSAYELPSTPGNGYLKVDTTNLVRFKAAYVSGPCKTPEETGAGQLEERGGEAATFSLRQKVPTSAAELALEPQAAPSMEAAREESGDGDSLLEVLVDRLADAGPPARQVWLPPLNEAPSLDELLPGIVPDPQRGMYAADYPGLGTLSVPLGVVDRPFEQSRELLLADLRGAGGHMGLAGAPQSGKSTMLRTLMISLALTHSPRDVQFYILDFGGALASVAGMPHVGSTATRLDRDRVLRTVEEISQLVEQREARFAELGLESMAAYRAARARGEIQDPYGDVFLVIDGWATLRQDFEELENRIGEIAARGLSFGVHLVAAAVRWSEFRPRHRDLFGTKFELRLGDPMESEVKPNAAKTVPAVPGRGLTKGAHHFLTALPRLDGGTTVDDLTAATKAAAAEIDIFWTGPRAPEVRMLPTRLPAGRLPRGEGARICLGLDEKRLAPVWHDFAHLPHLMVFGDSETGKTNALRLIAQDIVSRYQPAQARIVLGDPSRALVEDVPPEYRVGYAVDTDALGNLAGNAAVSMSARLPGADLTPERLAKRDWWTGPELFVLVDDYDLFVSGNGAGGPMVPLVRLLAASPHIGLHLVVARSTSGAMRSMMDPVIRRLWELGAPALLLSYPKEEGKFLGEAKPRTLPPGRAQLVTRRDIKLVQLGLAGADD
ncbi:MAG TPA: type VII secretion protein EccCa [Actinocrinis sp.]|uniref:type VII secretion protein EccCa n=1 Tax=Actinocrinis sp. TaxID=1920516 RepID=UPI002DDCFE9B|nr:type VII secretion protein EccCa [Actinocrinis sp.]HEV3170751.1 type VII secretion protein EccCa [Actinocrinis sp.]